MATFNIWKGETTNSTTGYLFSPSLNFSSYDDSLTSAYGETNNYNGGKAPWNVSLYDYKIDFFGNELDIPTVRETYTVPATDINTKASFPFKYEFGQLGGNLTGLFWTTSANASYGPLDQTVLNYAPFEGTGTSATASPIQLQLNGTTTAVADLYDLSFGYNATFGSSFIVAFSTYDPGTHDSQISYEHFSDAGAPLNGGVVANINDGTAHGVDFATYYPHDSLYQTPAFALEYRLPVGETAGIHVLVLSPDGITTRGAFDILDYGTGGQPATGVDDYGFSSLSATDPQQQYGIFTQTYHYKDSSSIAHEDISIETVTSIGTTSATFGGSTKFEISNGNTTGVGIARIPGGNFVIAYSDGGQTYLKEYTSTLTQVGSTFAVPDDNDGFTNLASLGDGRVMLEWRQSVGTSYDLHSAIYDTRQSGQTITPAAGTA